MPFALAPSAQLEGYRLEAHQSVGSTNALALERAQAGDPGRLWVVSTSQQTGRGRRGRAWATPPGNLAATLLLPEARDLGSAATLGFVAGLALADALKAVMPDTQGAGVGIDGAELPGGGRFELKWPNDVLAGKAKLAGILLESASLPQERYAIAIGIGVNVVSFPEDTPYPATSLARLGAACDAETLFLALSDAWMANSAVWDGGRGLAQIRARWLDQAAGLGSEVAVRHEGRIVRGVFETIDEACRFVIRENDGTRLAISAGDVHFGAVASASAV